MRTLPELRDVASDQQKGLRLTWSLIVIPRRASAFCRRQWMTPCMTRLDSARSLPSSRSSTNITLCSKLVHNSQDPDRPLAHLCEVGDRDAGAALFVQSFRNYKHLSGDQPPGAVPRGDYLIQPCARESLENATKAIAQVERDLGMPVSIHPSFQGTAAAFQNSLASEPWLILAALVTVYIVLGVLYESYIHPVTILSTLPSAGVPAGLVAGRQPDPVRAGHVGGPDHRRDAGRRWRGDRPDRAARERDPRLAAGQGDGGHRRLPGAGPVGRRHRGDHHGAGVRGRRECPVRPGCSDACGRHLVHVDHRDKPAGTGTVDVVVSTSRGTSATSAADQFTYQ